MLEELRTKDLKKLIMAVTIVNVNSVRLKLNISFIKVMIIDFVVNNVHCVPSDDLREIFMKQFC